MVVIIFAILVIVAGIIQIILPNFVWKTDKIFHEMQGIEPRQSDAYEAGRVLRGVFFMAIGLGILLLVYLVPLP